MWKCLPKSPHVLPLPSPPWRSVDIQILKAPPVLKEHAAINNHYSVPFCKIPCSFHCLGSLLTCSLQKLWLHSPWLIKLFCLPSLEMETILRGNPACVLSGPFQHQQFGWCGKGIWDIWLIMLVFWHRARLHTFNDGCTLAKSAPNFAESETEFSVAE